MFIFVILATLVVIFTLTKGVLALKGNMKKDEFKNHLKLNVSSLVAILTAFIIMAIPQVAHAAAEGNGAAGLGFIAAGLSTGLAAIGAGYAVGAVGSSALGAVSEDPKILGKTLIFVGLAEGIAIYGLIISIMILGRLR